MKLLEERIAKNGRILPGDVLKVDDFLNHMIDIELTGKIADEICRLYAGSDINKVMTVEASGIAVAALVAERLRAPMIFAKKTASSNLGADVYSYDAMSYTHGKKFTLMVESKFIGKQDKILIVDDFLATGNALIAMINIARQAGSEIVGAAVEIEKAYQEGGHIVRDELGIRCEALARVASMSVEEGIKFVQ